MEHKKRKEIRLQAVRDAYWANSDIDGLEFAAIHDSLVEFCEFDDPSNQQCKAVFDLLPSSLIGGGVQWGFDDSEVRDGIYAFVRTNAAMVKKSVEAASPTA